MKNYVGIFALGALGLGVWGCGANSSNNANPTSPSPSGGNVVTINVVAINGSQSFSPNPATLPAGQMVVWHNVDSVTHRVVLNDRSVDTGNLSPGASSSASRSEPSGRTTARFIRRWSVPSRGKETTVKYAVLAGRPLFSIIFILASAGHFQPADD